MLRIVGVSEATYYNRRKSEQVPKQERENKGGRPRPGYCRTPEGKLISDEEIKEWLLELVAGEEAAYGYRKLTLSLRRQRNLVISFKKGYRLCKELDILEAAKRLRVKHPRRIARNREITAPNQLWEMDIKYGYIRGEDRFFFLMGILDVYDRSLVDYHIGLSCEGKHAAQTLERALWRRRIFGSSNEPVIRTDNGPQFISHIFETACESWGVEHERIPPKTPNKNAHIESFHSNLERECLSKHEFGSYAEAYEVIVNYLDFYNKRRYHDSLYDLSPEEFQEKLSKGEIKRFVVKV
ncbi:Integrase [Acididesulfobacillus acetoxydans]|uniref:Integrase n=1 Tax=Acididesulfobacillus acetoxydans TaxID=1561005 RepID=A0A8S0VW98_9FIRM|nr:IS3 family transposase [Acididesulfobacillus acetoxydans]CAA7600593.1 Integrase [Acididesulfobacillus acetoxydans]